MIQEECEIKIKELEKENKNEISHFKDEYEDLEQNYHKYVIKTENDINTLNERIVSLEASLKETKDNLNNAQLQYNNNLDRKNEAFNHERKELLSKIDKLTKDLNFKEITSLKFKKDTLEKENEEYEIKFKKDKETIDTTIKKLKEENELLKQT